MAIHASSAQFSGIPQFQLKDLNHYPKAEKAMERALDVAKITKKKKVEKLT